MEATRKSLEVLEYLHENGPSTLSEITRGLGNAKSTVFRHLKTLERAGYVAEGEDGYRIGLIYLDYGIQARRRQPLYREAKAKVDALAEQVGEKVWCAVEENGYAVYAYFGCGDELYESFTRSGIRGHLHAFSAGKCLLACMPTERIERIVRRRGLPAYTEHTITDEDALFEELERVEERGYAFHREEAVEGSNAVAVPIQSERGAPLGAISISGPVHRLDGEYFEEELPYLLLGIKHEVEMGLRFEE